MAPKSHRSWADPFFPLPLLFPVPISCCFLPFFLWLLGSILFSRLQNPIASKVFPPFFPIFEVFSLNQLSTTEVFLLLHFDPSQKLSELRILPIFPAHPRPIPPSTFPGHCRDPPRIAKTLFLDGKFSWFGEIAAEFGAGGLESAAFGLFLLGLPREISADDPGRPEHRGGAASRASGHQIHRISPRKSPFFLARLGKNWWHLAGAEEFQRVGWGPGEGELIPQPFPGRIPGILVGFN